MVKNGQKWSKNGQKMVKKWSKTKTKKKILLDVLTKPFMG
jgi:hypothetical protein